MLLSKSLPLTLLLLIANVSPSSGKLLPHAIHKAHKAAVRQTHSLARDLRTAFGAVLVSSPQTHLNSRDVNNKVVYCKGGNINPGANTTPTGGSPSGNSTTTRGGSSTARTRTSTGANPSATVPASSPWKLTEGYEGTSFFEGWSFFTGADPTNGVVQYVDENTARSNGLLEVNAAGNAVMRADTTPNIPGNRQSVRITTDRQFTGGLVIMDAVHMPTGCGTWPAFWTNGPNWPHGGEIDIVEGVHDYTNNQATIHTDADCTLGVTDSSSLKISGTVIGGTNCAALTTGNQGCGIRADASNSFGAGFNAIEGGVYAMLWDGTGVAVYFFPRGSIPADIDAGVPQPTTWGLAQARWPASSCDPFRYFNSHHAIFDTTFCGDWAGGVWNAAGIPGQEQSCAARTGFPTCEAFVRSSGASFVDAYWEVKSVKIYQTQN